MAGNWDGKVLLDLKDNDVNSYCPPSHKASLSGYAWVRIEDFEGPVEYIGYFRGRTAVGAIVQIPTGETCPMFLKDFDRAIRHYGMDGTTIRGVWRMVKKGNNVGLAPRIRDDVL